MNDNQKPEGNLRDEFSNLGKNLADVLHTAWDSVEAARVKEEVVSGLTELGATLRREAENFSGSSAAQQLKDEMQQVGERVRSAEFQNKVHSELVAALKNVNEELQKVVANWSATTEGKGAEAETPGGTEAPAETDQPGAQPPDPHIER